MYRYKLTRRYLSNHRMFYIYVWDGCGWEFVHKTKNILYHALYLKYHAWKTKYKLKNPVDIPYFSNEIGEYR